MSRISLSLSIPEQRVDSPDREDLADFLARLDAQSAKPPPEETPPPPEEQPEAPAA
jgi:hypothetical protein